LNQYSPIEMCCGILELKSSQTNNVAHNAIALV